mgnify:CR=1 FL=1
MFTTMEILQTKIQSSCSRNGKEHRADAAGATTSPIRDAIDLARIVLSG